MSGFQIPRSLHHEGDPFLATQIRQQMSREVTLAADDKRVAMRLDHFEKPRPVRTANCVAPEFACQNRPRSVHDPGVRIPSNRIERMRAVVALQHLMEPRHQ